MIKVLILAYDFPPYTSVGAIRPYSFFKHFHENNIYPTVITRQWIKSNNKEFDYIRKGYSTSVDIETIPLKGTIIKTPFNPILPYKLKTKFGNRYKYVRKGISLLYEIFQYIFLIGAHKNIYTEANNYLKENKVDLIIATGSPFVLFKYASKLSKLFQTPWVADYRDPWTNNRTNKFKLINKFYKILENKYSNSALFITTTTDYFLKIISENVHTPTISIIRNGYDFEAIEKSKNVAQSDDFLTIGFTGTIYSWNPIYNFINAIHEYIDKNPSNKIYLNFYGINIKEDIEAFYKNKPIKVCLKFYDPLPNESILQELAKCNVLLLFDHGKIMGTKIYEYIALKRKILFYKNDDTISINENPQLMFLKSKGDAIIVKNEKEIINALTELNTEFVNNKCISSNSKSIYEFTRKKQVEEFSKLIKMHLKK